MIEPTPLAPIGAIHNIPNVGRMKVVGYEPDGRGGQREKVKYVGPPTGKVARTVVPFTDEPKAAKPAKAPVVPQERLEAARPVVSAKRAGGRQPQRQRHVSRATANSGPKSAGNTAAGWLMGAALVGALLFWGGCEDLAKQRVPNCISQGIGR